MIVGDFHLKSVAVLPAETDSPLLIYTNTARTFPITAKPLKAIARRYAQVVERGRRIQHEQLSQRRPLNGSRDSLYWLPPKEPFRLLIGKGADHS